MSWPLSTPDGTDRKWENVKKNRIVVKYNSNLNRNFRKLIKENVNYCFVNINSWVHRSKQLVSDSPVECSGAQTEEDIQLYRYYWTPPRDDEENVSWHVWSLQRGGSFSHMFPVLHNLSEDKLFRESFIYTWSTRYIYYQNYLLNLLNAFTQVILLLRWSIVEGRVVNYI